MSTPVRRQTRQRSEVRAALDASEEFRSAQDLHAELRAAGSSIGLNTVYRSLAVLAADGDVDSLRTDSGETVYRACATERHHHHLVCRICGATAEVEGPEVEAWAERVAATHGYTQVAHEVEVFGLCPLHGDDAPGGG